MLYDYSMELERENGEGTLVFRLSYCGTKKCGKRADVLAERALDLQVRPKTVLLLEAPRGWVPDRPAKAADRVISLL